MNLMKKQPELKLPSTVEKLMELTWMSNFQVIRRKQEELLVKQTQFSVETAHSALMKILSKNFSSQ